MSEHLFPGREHAEFFILQSPGVSIAQMNDPCLMYKTTEG